MRSFFIKFARKAISGIAVFSVLVTAVSAGFCSVGINALADSAIWSGSGTAEDPYEVADAEQLREVVKCGGVDSNGNKLYFELVNDISLNNTSNWNSVGFSSPYTQWEKGSGGDLSSAASPVFRGDLQGNGHTISGLFSTGNGGAGALFPLATGGANVSNLKIDKAYINVNNYAGAVFGRVIPGNAGAVTVSYVYVTNSYIKTYLGACGAGLVGAAHHGGALNIQGCALILGEKGGIFGALPGAMLGDAWSCSVSISNSWSSGYPLVKHSSKAKTWNISNCYTDVDPNLTLGTGSFLGVVTSMKGASKAICPNLDDKIIWKFIENDYPVLRNVQESVNGKEGEIWSGATANEFAGGSGTKLDPYIIKTGEQLYRMIAEKETGAYYELGADIYLNDVSQENWQETALPWAIGSTDDWQLHFEGNGHKISGLYINSKGQYGYSGLIPVAGNGTSIVNVHIVDSYIFGQKTAFENYSAAFVGFVAEGAFDVVIGGCSVASSVVFGGGQKGAGFIGGMNSHGSAIIYNCGFAGNMDVSLYSNNYAAGFLADSWTQGGGLAIYNSYCAGVPAVWKANGNTTATRLYSTVSQEETSIKTLQVMVISEEQMKGKTAKSNMAFDWDAWQTVENDFPIPSFNFDRRDGTPGKVWSGLCAQNYEPYTADYAYPAGYTLENPNDSFSKIVDATGAYFYGDGTEEYPYHIATGEQLYKLVSQNTNLFGAEDEQGVNVCYELIADIYLNDVESENWENKTNLNQWYVGSQGGAFRGHFNGNGHIVVGLYYDRLGNNCTYGLFPVLGEDGIVENVGVVSGYINGQGLPKGYNEFAAAIVGYISDYKDPGDTTEKLPKEELEALGFTLPIIRNCFADADTVVRAKYSGGIVCGIPSPFVIEDCYFLGTVRGIIAGGIVGDAWPKNVINANRCYCVTTDNDRFAAGNWADGGVKTNCYAFAKTNTREVTYVYALAMRGELAKQNMAGLFEKNDNWMVVEGGSPVLKIFGDRAVQFSDTKYRPTVIDFSTNSEECEIEALSGTYGDPVTLPIPTREGYEFEGWYYYKELQCKAEINSFPMISVTLYAKWAKKTVEQDFENYPDTEYDRDPDGDYEIYRPGSAADYSSVFVHGGAKSLHRKGDTTTAEDVLLNYEETLVKNTVYELTFWVMTDESDTNATISLVRNTWPDIDIANEPITGVEQVVELKNLVPGEWNEITYKFVADTEWVSLRTSGEASLYFDDFRFLPIGTVDVKNEQAGGNNVPTSKPVDSDLNASLSPATADNTVSLVVLMSAFAAAAVVLLFSEKHLTEVIDN